LALNIRAILIILFVYAFFAWGCITGDVVPYFDYKKRTIMCYRGWLGWIGVPSVIKIDDVKEKTWDYDVSVDKNGQTRETFTVRALGKFGSQDFRFRNRRDRDYFEHVLQEAMNGETAGNTNISPTQRIRINTALTFAIFSMIQIGVFAFAKSNVHSSQDAVHDARQRENADGALATSPLETQPDNLISGLEDDKKPSPGGSTIPKSAVGTQTDNVTITSKDWASVQLDEASKSKPDGHPKVPNGQKPMEQQVPATPKPESSTVEASATTPSVKMDPVRSDEMASVPTRNSETAGIKIKLAEVQGELAVVNSKIEAERKRWQDANAAINALTNNKTRPVVRNSPEHVQMYEAQVIMKQVEAGAASLKEEKSRLEAMIKSLQESAP
jgi:hypothetical protein